VCPHVTYVGHIRRVLGGAACIGHVSGICGNESGIVKASRYRYIGW